VFKQYEEIFNERGALYNKAMELCPDARGKEREELITRLQLHDDLLLCDIPAGGGYVADGIHQRNKGNIKIINVEPSLVFARGISQQHVSIVGQAESIPLTSNCVDRVSSLAGIHHMPDKQLLFNEVARILKPNGLFVVADVQVDTSPARFLNDAVDRLTETGHEGLFLEAGELTRRLTDVGFINIREELVNYTWDFPSHEVLVQYCLDLFGMVRATKIQVDAELQQALKVIDKENSTHLEWCLVYAVGQMK
jgi:ubiquinone/menaquinone biosynthesis C-methylase UbiE